MRSAIEQEALFGWAEALFGWAAVFRMPPIGILDVCD